MLHETSVSWLRYRLAETVPKRSWEETPEAFGIRLPQSAPSLAFEVRGPGTQPGFSSAKEKTEKAEPPRKGDREFAYSGERRIPKAVLCQPT